MPALPPDLAAKLARCAVPTLVSVMAKAGLGANQIRDLRAVDPGATRFVARAVTLQAVPQREDLRKRLAAGEFPNLQAEAFERVGPGEALVIGALGERRCSVFGDVMATYAKVRGASAIVIDGCVSDWEAIATIGLPVFASGNVAVAASLFLHFTAIDVAVGCAGVAVCPGDVLVGDGNGVAVIPAAHAEAVAEAALEQEELETFVLERIRAGAKLVGTYPPDEATRAAFRAWRAKRG